MKILVIGDPHFKVDNVEESEHFLLQVQQWLVNNPVNTIVILGDILHSHEKIFTFALRMAVKFIKMCASFAFTYCLVGNHDATSNTIYCSSNHWMGVLEGLSNVAVVESPKWHTDQILLCPYVSDGCFMKMLEEFSPEYKRAKVIFAHQLFDGGQMGALVASGVERWDIGLPQIISGHLHDRQHPQPNLYYVGSSQQLAFNERGDKSIACVTVQDNGVRWDEVYLSLKQRKVVYTNVPGVPGEVTKIQAKPLVTFKVLIKDTEAAIKAFKKTVKYKALQDMANVASVQFKVIEDATMGEASAVEDRADFLGLLRERVEKDTDPYLLSYMNSCLGNTEDLSDKAVEL